MIGGLGEDGDKVHICNLSTAGDHTAVSATTNQCIFVSPKDKCEILDISLAVTTAITAHTSNNWTIAITNQTGDVALLSTNFDTDFDNSGNGGRELTADTANSLCDNGAGGHGTNLDSYLQNNILAKGDMLVLTATKAASAGNLTYPTVIVKYR